MKTTSRPVPAAAPLLLLVLLLLAAACQSPFASPGGSAPAKGASGAPAATPASASAASGATAAGGSTLERIQRSGRMRVGYLVAEPMIGRHQETREIEGIFADMVRQIARTLNVEVVWVETNLASFAAGLQSDLFDFSVGPSFLTIPRAAAVAFTDPVAYVGNSAVVRADGPLTAPKSLQDFNKKGLRVAVLQGQALEEYSRRNLPDAEVIVISGGDLTAPLVAVSAGRADVGLMNSLTITQYTQEHPELRPVLMGADSVEILPLAWATRKSDVDLRDFLNASIAYLGSTGRIYEYQKKQPLQLLYGIPQLREAP